MQGKKDDIIHFKRTRALAQMSKWEEFRKRRIEIIDAYLA